MTKLSLALTLTLISSLSFAQGSTPAPSYGFLVHVAFNDPADKAGAAVIGVLNLDGAGGVSGPYTIEFGSNSGNTSQGGSGTLNGAYTTNPDGTGTLTITLPEVNATLTFATVLTDGGQGMQLLSTQGAGNANNLGGGVFPMSGSALALTGTVPLGLLANGNFSGGSIPVSLKGTLDTNTGTVLYTATGSGTGTTTCFDGSSSPFTATVSAFSAVVYLNPGATPGGATGDYLLAVNVNACGGPDMASLSGIVSGNFAPNGAGNLLLHGNGVLLSGIARAGQMSAITGPYGYQFESSGFPGGNVGVMNFDGAGNLTVSFTSVGTPGTSLILPTSTGARNGTYTLKGDGTGTIALTPPAGSTANPATYSFVITDNGAQLLILRTDSVASPSIIYGPPVQAFFSSLLG